VTGQSVDFDFTSRGADKLASDFRKTGDNAVIAAKGARLCADALEKQRKAADVSAGATLALAKADDILKEAEHGLAEGALEAEFALKKQAEAAKKAGVEAAAAEAGVTALAGTGGIPGGGMGALIAAGVALSPIVATLGVGLGGLGLAAVGVAKPVADAAQKTGGLAANMSKLNPEQQALAVSILGLGKQYDAFQKALQPEVLGIFNTGIKLAGGLLRDIQPVAAATGKALDGFLGQIDAEFRSRTWQDFFGFMAAQAGPDMKLLAGAILPLLDTLPKLLTDIQPIAVQFLQAAAGAARLGDAAVTLNEKIQHLGTQADHSGGFVGRLAGAAKQALGQILPGIPAAQALGKWLGVLGSNSDKAGTSTGKAGDAFKGAWPKAQSYAQWVAASAKATTDLANAQSAAVSTQLAYGNDILTSANDAQTFHDKLKASAGQIGLHTQAQRDSFGAANQYIGDLARQATTAIQSGHGTDAAIAAIRNGLPALDSAKTKNKQYWQEVATLVAYLRKLEFIKFITTPIHVLGSGKWSVTGTTITPGAAHGPQNIGAAPGGFAAGGRVPFSTGTPGKDSVLVMTKPGEIFIPPEKGPMLAPALRAAGIPGFAAGGVAGSYGPGKVSGLPRWIGGRIDATDTAIAQNTAQAILNAMASAQAQARASKAAGLGNLPLGLGPHSGSAAVAQAFAKSILWAYGWGADQFPPLQALWNQESGWNSYAVNPSSGAYGIPQSLGHGHPYNLGDYQAQIRWGLAYIKQRYGSPSAAWAHERAFNWYARGGVVPGFASGGTVAGQGAAYLKAWQTRHGGGFGAAWGPVVVNEQIAAMAAAQHRASVLAGAAGLTPGQHRFWAATAADETRRLGTLHKELVTERAWRSMLGASGVTLAAEIAAAGSIPSLRRNVLGWRAQLARQKATIAGISAMLGYSDAHIAADVAAGKLGPGGTPLPGITHTYGGVTDVIEAFLAAHASPFARGGLVMDAGGWLRPGWNPPMYNGTGRPEPVGAARGGGGIHLHLTVNAPVGSQRQLEDWFVMTANKTAHHGRLTQAVRAAGR
jgi:hypothetical protein